jgi:hypothetical protein
MPLHILANPNSIRSFLQVIFSQSNPPVAVAEWSHSVQIEQPFVVHLEAWRLGCHEYGIGDFLSSPHDSAGLYKKESIKDSGMFEFNEVLKNWSLDEVFRCKQDYAFSHRR